MNLEKTQSEYPLHRHTSYRKSGENLQRDVRWQERVEVLDYSVLLESGFVPFIMFRQASKGEVVERPTTLANCQQSSFLDELDLYCTK